MNQVLNKVVKLGLTGAVVLGLVGCASNGSIANKYVNNDKVEGVIYGASLFGDSDFNISNICNSIGNKDERCQEQHKYKIVGVCAKFGYADAFTGITAFAPKDMDIGEAGCGTGNDKCTTYLKAKVEKGKLGTVLEVASRPGDGKCHWSGMPRAGGTVCPDYNYDYRKDFNGIPR